MARNPKPERQWYRRVYGFPHKDHVRKHRQALRRLVNLARQAAALSTTKEPS